MLKAVLEAAKKLHEPGVIGVVPTDTVYGVVARAADKSAVERLYALKKRDAKPGTLVAANIDQLVELGIPRRYLTAVEQFWPGAVSVVIPCGDNLAYLHHGLYSLAVRIPDNENFRELLNETGALLTSSANHPSKPPANTVDEAKEYFGGEVDFYIDGGDLSGHKPSTVIRIVDDAIEILRAGAVHIDESGRRTR
jgi:L-threonylcarbamoyladenylate synthase